LVALVDEQQSVFRQVLEQGRRRLAGEAAGEEARVILDAGALPVAAIISRSKLVRCSSRCASRSLPSETISLRRSSSSCLIAPIACFSVGPGVT
jgi:hypothetical protein